MKVTITNRNDPSFDPVFHIDANDFHDIFQKLRKYSIRPDIMADGVIVNPKKPIDYYITDHFDVVFKKIYYLNGAIRKTAVVGRSRKTNLYDMFDVKRNGNYKMNIEHEFDSYFDFPDGTIFYSTSTNNNFEVKIISLSGEISIIECSHDTLVSDLKKKFGNERDNMIYAGKYLDDGKHLSHYGICEGSEIYVIMRLRGGGAFVDVHECEMRNNHVQRKGTLRGRIPNGEIKPQILAGLSIETVCVNPNCRTYNKNVITHCAFITFDVVADWNTVRCVYCDENVIPFSCGFYDCAWKYIGVREGKVVSKEWSVTGKNYVNFKFPEENQVKWDRLLISAEQSVRCKMCAEFHDDNSQCNTTFEQLKKRLRQCIII